MLDNTLHTIYNVLFIILWAVLLWWYGIWLVGIMITRFCIPCLKLYALSALDIPFTKINYFRELWNNFCNFTLSEEASISNLNNHLLNSTWNQLFSTRYSGYLCFSSIPLLCSASYQHVAYCMYRAIVIGTGDVFNTFMEICSWLHVPGILSELHVAVHCAFQPDPVWVQIFVCRL